MTTLVASLSAAESPSSPSNRAALLIFAAILILAAIAYLAPTIAAALRRSPAIGSVAAINILLGWSLVGWALAWAIALRRRSPTPAHAAPSAMAAGWYPDPLRPSRVRYWTGAGWSDAVHEFRRS